MKVFVSLLLWSLYLCLTLPSCDGQKIMYYIGDWSTIPPSQIRYSDMTHLIYSFLVPNADATFQGINEKRLREIVSLAHSNGAKVLISVGGGSGSDNFKQFANTTEGRTTFLNHLLDFINQFQLDGADIDWEYPNNGYSETFTSLMQSVSASLRPRGLLVTSAVPAMQWTGKYYPASSFEFVDYFNIMAYDFSGSWAPKEAGPHASYEQILSSLNYWLTERNLPPSQAVLGIPFYGKDFNKKGAAITYSRIVSLYHPDASVNQIGQTYFDGIDLVQRKCQLALMKKLGGVMVWEYSQDSNGPASLITAISSVLKSPSSGPSEPSEPSPPKPTPSETSDSSPPQPSPSSLPFCGYGKKGNGKCEDSSECCSQYGWCGTSAAHCAKHTKK